MNSTLKTCLLVFDRVRILRNAKKYEIAMNTIMSDDCSSGNNSAMSNQEVDVNSETEARILTRCDECLVAGQIVFLRPTVYLLRQGCFFESHFSHLIKKMCCFFSDKFLKETVVPKDSPRSKNAITLAATLPDDAFKDLTANSIFGMIILTTAVKIAYWMLFLTASTLLPLFR